MRAPTWASAPPSVARNSSRRRVRGPPLISDDARATSYVRAIGFVDNPAGKYSRLQTLTIEEFRKRQAGHPA
jgi:hypothetical protein